MSAWTAWSECSASCGVGVQKAVREVISIGDGCQGVTRTRSCTEKPCSLAGLSLSHIDARPAGYPLFDPYGPPPSPRTEVILQSDLEINTKHSLSPFAKLLQRWLNVRLRLP